MKQFGTTHLNKKFCSCCVIMANPRAKVKSETEKLIREEQDEVNYLGYTLAKSEKGLICGVCGDFDNPDCITEC